MFDVTFRLRYGVTAAGVVIVCCPSGVRADAEGYASSVAGTNQGTTSFTIPGNPDWASNHQHYFLQRTGFDGNAKEVDVLLESDAQTATDYTKWSVLAFASAQGPCGLGDDAYASSKVDYIDRLHVVSDVLGAGTAVDVLMSCQYTVFALTTVSDSGFRPTAEYRFDCALNGLGTGGAAGHYTQTGELVPFPQDNRIGKPEQRIHTFVGDTLTMFLSMNVSATANDQGERRPVEGGWQYWFGGGNEKVWAGQNVSGPFDGTLYVTPSVPFVRIVADSGNDYALPYADPNGDGLVNMRDVVAVASESAGLSPVLNVWVADVAPYPSDSIQGFGDGKVDLLDAFRLLRHLNGLDNNLPWSSMPQGPAVEGYSKETNGKPVHRGRERIES